MYFVNYLFLSVFLSLYINSLFFFFSSRRRHTRYWRDWSSDVCSSDLPALPDGGHNRPRSKPGQAVRLPGRRARGHARRAGCCGPPAQGQGLARAPLRSLGGRRPAAGAETPLRTVFREVEELAGEQQLVAAQRGQVVEVASEVARVGAVEGEKVVVGRHDQAEV